jgi:lipoprotein-anchoring transpeptidase ErfK/SrfK
MNFSSRTKIVMLIMIAFAVCALVVAARKVVFAAAPSAILNPVTATHPVFYSVVELIKPTYTPTPLPTSSPTLEPTATLMQVDLPLDTSVIVDPTELEEVQTLEAPYEGNKYILVDISEQHMYVYEGDHLVNSFVASTGMNNGTRVGSFSVLDKIPNAYGATWDLWMPNWLGIYWSGSLENGIHALPILSSGVQLWEGYLGTPISYGCVVLGVDESQWLYDWSEVGTPVDIQW